MKHSFSLHHLTPCIYRPFVCALCVHIYSTAFDSIPFVSSLVLCRMPLCNWKKIINIFDAPAPGVASAIICSIRNGEVGGMEERQFSLQFKKLIN